MTAKHHNETVHGQRAMLRAAVLAAVLALAGCQPGAGPGGQSASGDAAAPADDRWAADHHMHIFSEDLSRLVVHMCKCLGCPEGFPTAATDVPAAMAALDAAGIRQGTLLSAAYLYGAPEAEDMVSDVAGSIRAENQATLARADASCGRLVPFIGVDPLDDSALGEIDYWGSDERVAGVKLHMAANHVDLRDDAQLARLAAVFARAAAHDLAIVIHVHNRNQAFGETEVRNFMTRVLPSAGGMPVQIAHAAGAGGAGGNTGAALAAFAAVLRERPELGSNLYFDIAAVPDVSFGEWVERASDESLATLRDLVAQIGAERFLLASDWVGVPELPAYYDNVQERLGLDPSQWTQLVARGAPYLRPLPREGCHP